MIPAIKEQFTPAILEQAAEAFGVHPDACKPLGGFEAYVYEYNRDEQDYILKITHTYRRSEAYILGELEFLLHLCEQGVSVSKPVTSVQGKFVTSIPSKDGSFLVISYIKAPGKEATKENWGPHLFEKWGQTMGHIHRVTGSFVPTSLDTRRQNWRDEEQLNIKKYVPYDLEMIQKMEEMLDTLEALPKTPETYGLVHEDFHPGNFFVDEAGEITLFDFDDCSYTYFINDISISMYYATHYPSIPFKNKTEEIGQLFRSFMTGYFREHHLDPELFSHVDPLIRLRHGMIFVIFHQTNDPRSLDENGQRMLREHREEILANGPFVPVDFKGIVEELLEASSAR